MTNKKFLSTVELAKILNISRIAVYKQIKKGKIRAEKSGRNFIISKNEIDKLTGKKINPENQKIIKKAVAKTVQEYTPLLKMLSKE